MDTDDSNNKAESEFPRKFVEMLSRELKIPVLLIDSEITDNLIEQVKQIPEIERKYSPDELNREVSNFQARMSISSPKNDDELSQRVSEFVDSLQKEKAYEAIFYIPGAINLPIGSRFGDLEIIEPIIDDSDFIELLRHLEKEKSLYIDNASIGRIAFQAYITVEIPELLLKILELPIAMITLILDFDLDPRDCIGIVKSSDSSNKYFLGLGGVIRGWSRYHPEFSSDYLTRLSKINLSQKQNRLHQKILQALQIYGLSRLTQKSEIRFIFLISSFESLLLTENDRDYLGKKISEKTTFLLEEQFERRMALYKFMKDMYAKRSRLIHGGKSEISDSDVRSLANVFRGLILKILELSDEYSKMEQQSHPKDKQGIEDYINKQKFS